MNKVSIQIKNTAVVKKLFRKYATVTTLPKIQIKVRDILRTKAPEMIISVLRQTETYQGLAGKFAGDQTGKDLQAEFGLSSSLAEDALYQIEKALAAAIRVDRSAVAGNLIRVYADKSLIPNIQTLVPGYTYTSTGGYEINWFDWLMQGENDRPIHADILYGTFPSDKSNSERAIMVDLGVGFWSYKTVDEPNFIINAINDPAFKKMMQDEYRKTFRQVNR